MKRAIITVTFAAVVAGASAQLPVASSSLAPQRVGTVVSSSSLSADYTVPGAAVAPTILSLSATEEGSAPRRAKSNGVYYAKPVGSMYNTDMGYDGSISNYRYLALPAWYSGTFTNMAANPLECAWSQYLVLGYGNVDGPYSLSALADENNDLSLSLTPDYTLPGGPMLEYGDVSYGLGFGDNLYWPPSVISYADFAWLSFLDNYEHAYFSNTSGLSTKYVLGTGQYTGGMTGVVNSTGQTVYIESGTYDCSGCYQMLPAPASPLYVRNIYIEAVTFSKSMTYEPIKNNAVITLDLYDTATGALLETLTATTGDYTALNNYWNWSGVTYLTGVLKFSKRVYDDAMGIEVEEPFVVDRAVTVDVHGFEDTDNIDLGMAMNAIGDCDEESEFHTTTGANRGAIPMFVDPTGTITPLPTIAYNMGLAVRFDALMDRVFAADTLYWENVLTGETATVSGYATLCLSAEGTECSSAVSDAAYDYGAFYVETCCPWYDDDGIANYSFSSLPDWITGITVDTSNYNVSAARYFNLVSLTASPNYDENARTFTTHIQGRGYTDARVLTVCQAGGAEVPEGITSVAASSSPTTGTYTVSGQRVSDNTKGLIIRDGKKIINK